MDSKAAGKGPLARAERKAEILAFARTIAAYGKQDTMAEPKTKSAGDVLASYRRWKEEGEELKQQAQGFLMDRFSELVREAQQVQQDLHEDFGHVVRFPENPKYAKKGRGRAPGRKAVSAPKAAPAEKAAARPLAAASPRPTRAPLEEGARKRDQLQRQVEKAQQRLDEARATGSAVKIQNAEDRLYELTDELRLLQVD